MLPSELVDLEEKQNNMISDLFVSLPTLHWNEKKINMDPSYLSKTIFWLCVCLYFVGDFQNVTVCENDQLNIRCDQKSRRIAIYSVLFGRATTNTPKCLKNGYGYAGMYCG